VRLQARSRARRRRPSRRFESSAAFLEAYRRAFSGEELEIAWAAGLWPALHNARGELLYAQPPVALTALREQAEHRLRLAGA